MQQIVQIYTVRDAKSETFYTPQYFNTHAEAERFLKDMVQNNSGSPISKFPEDFDLWHLGSYDSSTGQINALKTPTHLYQAIQYVKTPTTMINDMRQAFQDQARNQQ